MPTATFGAKRNQVKLIVYRKRRVKGKASEVFKKCQMFAYKNVFFLTGWATFVKRRSAVQKINALPDATPEQLAANDDV